VVRDIQATFYNRERAQAWAKRHGEYAADVRTRPEFARRTNEGLAELKASHTGYYTPNDIEYNAPYPVSAGGLGGPVPKYDSIGADIAVLPEGTFVRTVFAGSPAQKAGLLRGDRIISADGKPFLRVDSFRGRAGQEVVLKIEREAHGPLLEKRVTPRLVNAKDEWLEAQRRGSRIVEHGGK